MESGPYTVTVPVSAETQLILERLDRVEAAVVANQAQIDAYAAEAGRRAEQLAAGLNGLKNDIDDLKARIPPETDTSQLDARMAAIGEAADALTALDVENP